MNKPEDNAMKCNMGGAQRAIWIVAGLALIAWALYSGAYWGWIGVVPLAAGLVGFCAINAILGINTCKTKSQDA